MQLKERSWPHEEKHHRHTGKDTYINNRNPPQKVNTMGLKTFHNKKHYACNMVILPKSPSHEVEGTRWYLPKDTRPIGIADCCNRIVANILRVTLAQHASNICHPSQRGFLLNRFLVHSVLDMDLECHKQYLSKQKSHL